jgi:hypothetical protein
VKKWTHLVKDRENLVWISGEHEKPQAVVVSAAAAAEEKEEEEEEVF